MVSISKKIIPSKKDLNKMDDWFEKKLNRVPAQQRDSAHMAGIELLENAVKYHLNHNIKQNVHFELIINKTIVIKITNKLIKTKDAQELIEHIDKINNGLDPRIQYMHRLKEIMENRIPNDSKLGLLRIAGEGNFNIEYNLSGDNITVTARKYFYKERNIKMDSLITKDFSIIVKDEDPIKINWIGKSRDLYPAPLIDDYLETLSDHLLEKEIEIDFSTMESMNSSTIPPILSFFKNLEEKRIRTLVKYSHDIYWQRASFKPLAVLIRDFIFVKITTV